MKSCFLKAYGKINLGLDVIRRREDGYHEVKMVMQTVNLYDTIFMKAIRKEDIIIKTNKPYLPVNENNIIYKAIAMLQKDYNLPGGVFVDLRKQIPVAAGMAGGSANAAVTLIGMDKIYRLNLSMDQLMEYGVKLGADVPYCIMRGTALAEGIGEKLTRIPSMPECQIVIAKPDISVSTKTVYQSLKLDSIMHPDVDGIIKGLEEKDLEKICSLLGNVLEDVTVEKHPVVEEYKSFLRNEGAINSLMSGSGPTVFGIFTEKEKAKEAASKLKNAYPSAQVHVTRPFNVS